MNLLDEDAIPKYKVSFVGPKTGGKTCIISRFHNDNFTPHADPTIGASFISHPIQAEKTTIILHIWDTAGEERYKCIIPMYFRGSAAVVIVFDLSSKPNFEESKEWFNLILNEENEIFNLYFVGNKNDLPRAVSFEEASEYAKSVNAKYIETSAKAGDQINELFKMIAEDIVYREDPSLILPRSLSPNEDKSGCCK